MTFRTLSIDIHTYVQVRLSDPKRRALRRHPIFALVRDHQRRAGRGPKSQFAHWSQRREGVNEAAHKLQGSGLIGYTRGRIIVLDRPGLEKRTANVMRL
jgi:hypothetical protein